MSCKKTILFLLLIFVAVIFCGCAELMKNSDTPSTKTWTFMAYLGGDNNLESYIINNIKDMEKTGSDAHVNVVIIADFQNYGLRGLVQKNTTGSTEIISNFSRIAEFDSASAESLVEFVQYCKTNYPASRYALVLGSHGAGWRERNRIDSKGIVTDDTYNSTMTMPELKTALVSIEGIIGQKLDILGFDACLMGMIEVGYQAKDYVNYLVASEASEPGVGWPFDTILSSLESNYSYSGQAFASTIVDKYYQSMSGSARSVSSTMSAVDLSKLDPICSALKSFIAIFPSVQFANLRNLRDQKTGDDYTIQAYEYTYYRDLYDFAAKVAENFSNVTSMAAVCASIETAVSDAVASHKETGTSYSGSHGMSIYLPTASQYLSAYADLDFAASSVSSWESFINAVNSEESSISSVTANFKAVITWEGDADVDLICQEDRNGSYTSYQAFYTTVTPNGNFSLDSAISGDNTEYFQSLTSIEPIKYWFMASYYADGIVSTSAEVYLSIYKGGILQTTYKSSDIRGAALVSGNTWDVVYYDAKTSPYDWHASPNIATTSFVQSKSPRFIGFRRPVK